MTSKPTPKRGGCSANNDTIAVGGWPRPSGFRFTLAGLSYDTRRALRQIPRERGLSAVIIATLALCIGSTTAIFSMVHALMLKPLPFAEPDRIVELYNSAKKVGLDNMPSNVVQYLDYRRSATSYESLALWAPITGMYGQEGALEPLRGARVTTEFFALLRVHPLLGSFFDGDGSGQETDKIAILTQSFWENQLGADPDVVGQTIRVDGENLRVVGVAPRVVEAFDARVRFYRPLVWSPEAEHPLGRYSLNTHLYGRLKPGITIEQATAEAALIERRYYEIAAPSFRQFVERSGIKLEVGGVRTRRVNLVRNALFLLQGGVAFVLLIGCANVANLLLLRANARQSELAIRAALGATQGAVARQLLVESLVLTGIGALLGLGVAWGVLKIISRYTVELVPYALPLSLDAQVLGYGVGLTMLVGVGIGFVPMAHVLRANLVEVIRRSSRCASPGLRVRMASNVLVAVQIAVALMLLTGAGLLIRSFANALDVDPGFDPRGVVVARMALPTVYQTPAAANTMRERIARLLEQIPEVSRGGMALSIPFRGGLSVSALSLLDDPLPPGAPQPRAYRVFVTPGYMETLKLRLVEGRYLDESDMALGRQSYVVDETFAKKYFPNGSALGGRFTFGDRPSSVSGWGNVVGVVSNVPHNGVEDGSGIPFVYQAANFPVRFQVLFLRTPRSVSSIARELRDRIQIVDPAVSVYDVRTLKSAIEDTFDNRRGIMLLLVSFAMVALLLSALGVYGVLAFDVAQRTRDIGVRMALGATRRHVIATVLRQGLIRAVVGLGFGITGALLLGHHAAPLLFRVQPIDPAAYSAGSLLLLAVAALASFLPARRAASIDPIEALRVE